MPVHLVRRAAMHASLTPARRPVCGAGCTGGAKGPLARPKGRESFWISNTLQPGLPVTTTRLKLTVAYDGSGFAGFQWQKGKVRTVQGEMEAAAKRMFHGESRVVGASRTDGGAHAHGQVAHLDVSGCRDNLETDVMYINAVLPDDLKVAHIEVAPEGFDAQFSSLGKEYHYLLSSGLPNPLHAKQRWWVHDRWCERSRGKPSRLADIGLDVAAMQEAAEMLLGTHDFSAFMDVKRPSGLGSVKRKKPHLVAKGIKPVRTPEKNVRTLWKARVVEEGPGLARLEVAGNGFLYRMVRLLAAGLVEVGHGRVTPLQLQGILRKGQRDALPEAAPPHGLYLMQVFYEVPADVPADLVEAIALGRKGRQPGRDEAAAAAVAAAGGDAGDASEAQPGSDAGDASEAQPGGDSGSSTTNPTASSDDEDGVQ